LTSWRVVRRNHLDDNCLVWIYIFLMKLVLVLFFVTKLVFVYLFLKWTGINFSTPQEKSISISFFFFFLSKFSISILYINDRIWLTGILSWIWSHGHAWLRLPLYFSPTKILVLVQFHPHMYLPTKENVQSYGAKLQTHKLSIISDNQTAIINFQLTHFFFLQLVHCLSPPTKHT